MRRSAPRAGAVTGSGANGAGVDASTGEPLAPPLKHANRPSFALFSPDGRVVFTVTHRSRPVLGRGNQRAAEPSVQELERSSTRLLQSRRPPPAHRPPPLRPQRGTPPPDGPPTSGTAPRRSPRGRCNPAGTGSILSGHPGGQRGGRVRALKAAQLRRDWEALRVGYPGPAPSPSSGRAWHLRELEACEGNRQWSGALFHVDRLLEDEPTAWELYLRRAEVLVRLDQLDLALGDFTRSIDLHPDEWTSWYSRAKVRTRVRQWDGAVADCTRAIELNPKASQAVLLRGETQLRLRHWTSPSRTSAVPSRCRATRRRSGSRGPGRIPTWGNGARAVETCPEPWRFGRTA
jgi:hypothetical protein